MVIMLAEIEQIEPGRKTFSDQFFSEVGGINCDRFKLLGIIIEEDECLLSNNLKCEVVGSPGKLANAELEHPRNTNHKFECTQCKKLLASAHLLDLHLCEAHDSFFELQAAIKPMFSCFVVECTTKSWDSQQRMEHCVAAHNYPANFRYHGAPRKSASDAMDVDQKVPKRKNKKKVPPADGQQEVALPVLGGAGRQRRGRFAPNWHQKHPSPNLPSQPTSIDMQDIQDALPI